MIGLRDGMGRYEVVVRVRQPHILAFIISDYYKILYVGDCNIERVQPRNAGDVGVEAVCSYFCVHFMFCRNLAEIEIKIMTKSGLSSSVNQVGICRSQERVE